MSFFNRYLFLSIALFEFGAFANVHTFDIQKIRMHNTLPSGSIKGHYIYENPQTGIKKVSFDWHVASSGLRNSITYYNYKSSVPYQSLLYNSLENSIWSWDTFNQRYRKLPWSRKNETLSRLPEAPTTYWEHLPSLLSSSITDTTSIPLLSSHIPKDNTTTLSYRLHRAPYKYITYHINSKSHRISQMDLWNSKKQLIKQVFIEWTAQNKSHRQLSDAHTTSIPHKIIYKSIGEQKNAYFLFHSFHPQKEFPKEFQPSTFPH